MGDPVMADAQIKCTVRRRRSCLLQAILLSFVPILCLAGNSTAADELIYLIKFDEVGYDNVPGDVEKPPEKLYFSLPVLATLDEEFSARVVRSKRTYTVHGTLKRRPDGHYSIALSHKVVGLDGRSESENTVSLRPNERFEVGGTITKTVAQRECDSRHSKRALVVSLSVAPQLANRTSPKPTHSLARFSPATP
jgi:hypothetical protein